MSAGFETRALRHTVLLLLYVVVTTTAAATDLRPAIVYSVGGKFDKSFNESAYRGAEAFKTMSGIDYHDFEIRSDSESEQAIRNFARRGFDPIVAIGFNHASALKKVAPDFPKIRFAIVDMVVEEPNVRSIIFREHEGAYLVGLLAAMASQTGIIGFVGGMDIPLIRKIACGYLLGALAADPKVVVLQNIAGTTGAAWNDPVRGAELARSQIDRGADVIFHGAGTTGLGVLQAVADAGKLGIGVDVNQNYLHPDNMLTSMLKRVDIAVQSALSDAQAGNWESGVSVLGLEEGGLAWALDKHNDALVTDPMRAAVAMAEANIIAGELVVHDYMRDSACPIETR